MFINIKTLVIFLSCIFLANFIALKKSFSKNQFLAEEDKVISIFSLNAIYNNFNVTPYSKMKCVVEFYDDYKQRTTQIIDNNSNYVLMYSKAGKVYLDNIKCYSHSIPMIYGTTRFKRIDDWGFVAHQGFINYIGEINIKFHSSSFKLMDLINLSGISESNSDVVQIDSSEKIKDCLNYINLKFQNPSQLKIAKSLLKDTHSLKPNDIPEVYDNLGKSSSTIIENKITDNIDDKKSNSQTDNNTLNISNIVTQDNKNNNSNKINTTPQHPYLAPIYSEFYTPLYNPYYLVGTGADPNNFNFTETQDPVIENKN